MAKSKKQKQEMVEQLSDLIKASDALLVVSPKDVDPNEAADLKIQLDSIGARYHLIKNSLFKLALEEAGLVEKDSNYEVTGQNAVVFVGEKSPEAAKILKTFIKETEKAEFKEGFLEGRHLGSEEVKALADLPSKEELIAQVVGTMNAPIAGFVRVLGGNISGLLNVINSYKDQKSE